MIKLTRIKQKNRLHINEYNCTADLLYAFDVDYENDFSISRDSAPIYCGDKLLYFPERYSSLKYTTSDMTLFRPLHLEKHANIIIEMLEETKESLSNAILVIEGYTENGIQMYKGYYNNPSTGIVKSSIQESSSIAILKCKIAAGLMLDDYMYNTFTSRLPSIETFVASKRKKHV